MARSKSIYIAAAPLALLLIAGVGAHFLPILLGDDKEPAEETPPAQAMHLPRKPVRPEPTPIPMKTLDSKTQATLEKTVSGQLQAFQKDDFVKALSYSTPTFRATMTPDRFRSLIHTAYPLLARSSAQKFETAKGNTSQAIVPVLIASEDDAETRYIYMLTSVKGSWFVTGCSPMGMPAPSSSNGSAMLQNGLQPARF